MGRVRCPDATSPGLLLASEAPPAGETGWRWCSPGQMCLMEAGWGCTLSWLPEGRLCFLWEAALPGQAWLAVFPLGKWNLFVSQSPGWVPSPADWVSAAQAALPLRPAGSVGRKEPVSSWFIVEAQNNPKSHRSQNPAPGDVEMTTMSPNVLCFPTWSLLGTVWLHSKDPHFTHGDPEAPGSLRGPYSLPLGKRGTTSHFVPGMILETLGLCCQ